MVKIDVKDDCGNAPKKAFLRDFEIAFTKSDNKDVLACFDEKITWEMVGEQTVHGIDEADKLIKELNDDTMTALTIEHIITHGDTGAVNGTLVLDGSTFAFCDIVQFTSHRKDAKIKKLTSFVMSV